MGDKLARWPLLLAGVLFGAGALAVDLAQGSAVPLAAAMLAVSAACGGAFLYAEGARHREWWDRYRYTDERTTDDDPSD